MVARGEVWLVALDPTVGREIQKTRPCVVVSPPEINDHLRTVLVAPMTTGSRPAPFRVQVRFNGKTGLILLEQLRAVDATRLTKRLGVVDDNTLLRSLSILQAMFAM
jgi:mRNA interferase MazF